MTPRTLPHAIVAAAALLLPFAAAPQDPPTAPVPAAAPAAGRPKPHAFEGVYELRRRTIGGVLDPQPSKGWLVITQRHLFVCLAAPGPDPDLPLLRTGVRTWTADSDQLQTTVAMGWYTDADGNVQIEAPGRVETRRLEIVRGGVRLWQDRRDHLDFERVE
ncbi:MAG: hypothetical protein JNL08_17115 [Planctomycetes bacterium]|nr:hypothetical protein [Planctomycetota bacterium]